MKWRVAKSLIVLRNQVNDKFPNRNKDWDGTIGDANHASRKSDHNPWVDDGVVTAIDITHDPKHGVDSYEMAEELRQSRDARIKYIISNRKIASSIQSWKWRKYTGSNPHDHHVHISVNSQRKYYDDDAPWEIPMLGKVPSEAAEVAEAEGDDEQSVAFGGGIMSGVESIVDTADTVTTISAKAKPLFKSHISVGAATMGAGNVAVAATLAPPTLWEQFINIWKSPIWWLVVINVCLTIYIIWHYYKDHGRGALKDQQ